MQDFVMNTWYMAAWAEEVTHELMSRKFLGRAVLLTRDANGAAVAVRDRCPHRFALLSMGTREGDNIVCKYHGLTFDMEGRCVRNPYSDRIPAGATLERYPVVERDGIVWAWFGDPAAADPALVPDFSPTIPAPGGSRYTGYTLMNANYEYGTDNLLDLSHIEFLHTGTFAGRGVIFAGEHSVKQNGQQLNSDWWMPGVRCPGGLDRVLNVETADHWLDMRWDAPANMYLQVGATPEGQPREVGAKLDQAHILTPADVHQTHYFWSSASAHPTPPGHKALVQAAFDIEDKPMVEASYWNDDKAFWDRKPVSLGVDVGGTRARRIIEGMKAAEAAGGQG